jgi:hypothetical protein
LPKHTGLWSIVPSCPVLAAFEGNYSATPSIRGTKNVQGFHRKRKLH